MNRNVFIHMMVVAFLMAGITGVQAQNFNPNNQQQQEIEVSDSELQTFAQIMQEVQQAQKASQSAMLKAIKDNGLEVQRYQEIARAKQQGQDANMSAEEEKAYQAVQEILKQEQQKMRQKMNSILENYSMDRQRYIRISRALQKDKELQQRLQQLRQQQQPQQQPLQ